MRSLIIIEVSHGQTTDPLDEIVSLVRGSVESGALDGPNEPPVEVLDWTVKVDLPECFVLEGGQPKPIDYAEGMSNEEIAQELIDMGAFEAWLDSTDTLGDFYNRVMEEAAKA